MPKATQLDIESNGNSLSGKAQFHTGNHIGNWLHLPYARGSAVILILVGVPIVVTFPVAIESRSLSKVSMITCKHMKIAC